MDKQENQDTLTNGYEKPLDDTVSVELDESAHLPMISIWRNRDRYSVIIQTDAPFLTRLWILVSNPFTYLFKGKIRY